MLVGYILQQSTAWLYAHSDTILTVQQQQRYQQALEQRLSGYPMAYILGKRSFYHWGFTVTPDVLIPRPESELLIETATQQFTGQTIVDVGTGSGIIAISLALLLPDAEVYAVDISPAALEIARENAANLGASHIHFLEGNLLDDLPTGLQVDLIAANLPYIPTSDLNALDVARWEPRLALDGGLDGLVLIERLLQQAGSRLSKPGIIMLEIGSDQAQRVTELGEKHLSGAAITVQQDLAGLDRLVVMEN